MLSTLKAAARGMMKTVAFAALGNGPLLRRRLDRVREAGVITILNLHRVGEPDGSAYRPLSPALFDDLLDFVMREFAVITIAETSEPSSKPKLVLSFDDGYRDFLTTAAPRMRRRGIRANQNLIPKCVETGIPPLNVVAQDFVGQAPRELVDRLEVEGFTAPRDRAFPDRLSYFLKMRPQAEQDGLAEQLMPQFFAWDD